MVIENEKHGTKIRELKNFNCINTNKRKNKIK
jgi:hypothetical protein